MDEHDTSYKLLFAHDRMVRDLLIGFLPAEWVASLNLESLQKLNGSYVTEDLRGRHGDAVWRLRWGDDWLYVYLLLEFQSSVDRFMALRILVYTGLLHQDLIRQGELGVGRRLPPVLPIVLYNGERRWRAPTRLRPLIHVPPAGLESFQPDQSFLLIDEGAYQSDPPAPLDNLVAALFRLEHHRSSGEVATVLERLVKWLSDPEQAPLRRDYLIWLRRRLPRWFPGEVFPEFRDLQEVYEMIDNRFAEWKEQQRREGVLQGVAQGREQGLEQGRAVEARRLLGRLLARRFGPVSDHIQARLEAADTDQLELWIERLLDVNTLDDVFR
ncbi:MAG: Rpn family recombination-promoting nuclease/putative transposase [Alcanivorax sp.]|nr:Rpn family recombination-promoting nuclease/putative transposase [Alcanivorax sp.]